jgi:hypothetical protein
VAAAAVAAATAADRSADSCDRVVVVAAVADWLLLYPLLLAPAVAGQRMEQQGARGQHLLIMVDGSTAGTCSTLHMKKSAAASKQASS